ncbi:hypothetical protein B0H63DRAFT_523115 [Podospora didyma]|uniref:Uncharacterized protein n=1 Tax=Podospora didyma TaxID=330526 RepID=A0AAE0NQR1_9PEZI|nr:hypothetical protein B0H63DRAFT_523115 [Podospora didyma]
MPSIIVMATVVSAWTGKKSPMHPSLMRTVVSSINYTAPLELYRTEKPLYPNVPAPDGRQSNQVAWRYHDIEFRDIRNNMDGYTLDTNGSEIFRLEDKAQVNEDAADFDSNAWVEAEYYPVVERVLKAQFRDHIGVKVFDHTVSIRF